MRRQVAWRYKTFHLHIIDRRWTPRCPHFSKINVGSNLVKKKKERERETRAWDGGGDLHREKYSDSREYVKTKTTTQNRTPSCLKEQLILTANRWHMVTDRPMLSGVEPLMSFRLLSTDAKTVKTRTKVMKISTPRALPGSIFLLTRVLPKSPW